MPIHIKWKPNATAADMTEVIRVCKKNGWRWVPLGYKSGWWIFTRRLVDD